MVHWTKTPKAEEIKKRIAEKLHGNVPWNSGKKGWFPHDNHGFKKGNTPWNKDTHIQTNTGRTHFKKGQKSPKWKGGVSQIQSRIYNSKETRFWREEVFKRDEWICQKCGGMGDLECHHIIPVNATLHRVYIEGISKDEWFHLAMACSEMFDPENGITLCKQCHYTKHRKRVKK